MKHTVVLSDVHLCEAVPGEGLWMRYRQRRFFPDGDFAALFDLLRAEARGGELALVFNGDLFDFDAPSVIDGAVRFDEAPRTEDDSVATLGRILDDHAEFVDAIGRVLADGHDVVFVSGNHDAQLAWPRVRELLATRLRAAAKCAQGRVLFRAWFHHTPDGIHVEHGNQYDRYCAYRYPMEPFTVDGDVVQPTMGSLSFRHLVARMGYFNPHVDSSFMLSLPEYLAHWVRYYVRSPHSLAAAWAKGAVRVAGGLLSQRQSLDADRARRNVQGCADETAAHPDSIARHVKLFAPPSDEALHAVMRELWLDRVGLGAAGVAAVSIALFGGPLLAAKLALGVAGAITAYELVTPKPPLSETYHRVARAQRRIAAIYGARAVVFGHTHVPSGVWERGVFYGNSGTWSASFRDVECTQPVDESRPVIWLRSDEGVLQGGFYRYRSGMLVLGTEARQPLQIGPGDTVPVRG